MNKWLKLEGKQWKGCAGVDYPACERKTCIHWENGRCTIKNPEKEKGACLHYEDTMDALRLKADPLKGSLG